MTLFVLFFPRSRYLRTPKYWWTAKGAGGKGPRQKSSKIVKNIFDTFRHFSRRAKNRQKVSKYFSTLFDNFRAAPVFRPLLGGQVPNDKSTPFYLPPPTKALFLAVSAAVPPALSPQLPGFSRQPLRPSCPLKIRGGKFREP